MPTTELAADDPARTGRLAGKVAIITGAAQGQGEAEARYFAAQGACVVVADINDVAGAAVAGDLGDRALFQHLDVTDPAQWASAAEVARRRFGPVTVLVNNAALVSVAGRPQPLDEVSFADFRRVLEINLVGQWHGIRAALPQMRDAGGGSVINISSVGGVVASWGQSAYIVSKFGVLGLTKSAAIELGSSGIRVNAIIPGGVDTPMRAKSGRSPEFLKRLDAARALNRVGQPIEIARLACFLASDESSFCTGGEFVADGGQLAGDPRRFWESPDPGAAG